MIKDVVRFYPPDVWGVLCLNVWHNNGADDKFYQGVVSYLREYNIGAIVNCTTDSRIDYKDISIYNTFKKYVWHDTTPNNQEIYDRIQLELVKSSGLQEVSRVLNKELFNNHTYFLSSCAAFDYHVQNFYSHIKSWIVVGSSWDNGVHKGPLDIDQQLKLTLCDFNIFPEWSVQTESEIPVSIEQVEEDSYVWASIDKKGYRLVTRVGGKWQK